jgi:hypothetical protein
MKVNQFKKIIKEVVKEAVREELIEMFSTQTVKETQEPKFWGGVAGKKPPTPLTREAYMRALNETQENGFKTISMNTGDITQPLQVHPGMNTIGEGSALPAGEVSMEQIMGILNK